MELDDSEDDNNSVEDPEKESEEDMEEEDEELEGPRDVGGFTVLGEFKAKEISQADRVLPNWLRFPMIIKKEDTGSFSDIQALDRTLVKKLHENDHDKCFPVQWAVIPELLAQCRCGLYAGDAGFRQRDVCVSAPTGSGKTLTFALPIIQALQDRVVPHVRALVILPVKDLAIQVYQVFKCYTQDTPLKVVLLAGKKGFAMEQNMLVTERQFSEASEKWASAADVVVATRGRLIDHIQRTEGFDLTHLRFLVIDEADRQMEDIEDDWLTIVEKAAYTPKYGAYAPYHGDRPGPLTIASTRKAVMHVQKLLFSATLSQNPEKLEQMNLFMPLLFTMVAPTAAPARTDTETAPETKTTIDKFAAPALLTEKYLSCKTYEKTLILLHFILNKKFEQVLCFTRTVESAHRLFLIIKQMSGLKVAELSSNILPQKRERILRQFVRGHIQLLICSDVMTRGMDIGNVQYVISYDAPQFIETYIHRVGRTARANKAGTAITMVLGKEFYHFKTMLREAGCWNKLKSMNINQRELQPLVPDFQRALQLVPEILKEQKKKKKMV